MSTSQHFAVVVQLEDNGTVSAHVPGLPGVYAAADTQAGALRAFGRRSEATWRRCAAEAGHFRRTCPTRPNHDPPIHR